MPGLSHSNKVLHCRWKPALWTLLYSGAVVRVTYGVSEPAQDGGKAGWNQVVFDHQGRLATVADYRFGLSVE